MQFFFLVKWFVFSIYKLTILCNFLNSFNRQKVMRDKRKKLREKRRAAHEINMKEDIKELERRGKEEGLQRTLTSHLQLLCSLNMVAEVRYHFRNVYLPA